MTLIYNCKYCKDTGRVKIISSNSTAVDYQQCPMCKPESRKVNANIDDLRDKEKELPHSNS